MGTVVLSSSRSTQEKLYDMSVSIVAVLGTGFSINP